VIVIPQGNIHSTLHLRGDIMAEESGPEKYAPADRRVPERRSEEHIERVSQQQRPTITANAPADDLNVLVGRVANVSLAEIDRVISALEGVRDMMRKEGERVSREVAGYSSLSHAAVAAMKVLADSIKEWREGPEKSGGR
jgi:hypothetical protein